MLGFISIEFGHTCDQIFKYFIHLSDPKFGAIVLESVTTQKPIVMLSVPFFRYFILLPLLARRLSRNNRKFLRNEGYGGTVPKVCDLTDPCAAAAAGGSEVCGELATCAIRAGRPTSGRYRLVLVCARDMLRACWQFHYTCVPARCTSPTVFVSFSLLPAPRIFHSVEINECELGTDNCNHDTKACDNFFEGSFTCIPCSDVPEHEECACESGFNDMKKASVKSSRHDVFY